VLLIECASKPIPSSSSYNFLGLCCLQAPKPTSHDVSHATCCQAAQPSSIAIGYHTCNAWHNCDTTGVLGTCQPYPGPGQKKRSDLLYSLPFSIPCPSAVVSSAVVFAMASSCWCPHGAASPAHSSGLTHPAHQAARPPAFIYPRHKHRCAIASSQIGLPSVDSVPQHVSFEPAPKRTHRRACRLYDFSSIPVPYSTAWDWQHQLLQQAVQELDATGSTAHDSVILLQHQPVYTLGTASTPDNMLFNPDSCPIPVYRTERGGEVTYHGPGQVGCSVHFGHSYCHLHRGVIGQSQHPPGMLLASYCTEPTQLLELSGESSSGTLPDNVHCIIGCSSCCTRCSTSLTTSKTCTGT
jgi:hypothetical protein